MSRMPEQALTERIEGYYAPWVAPRRKEATKPHEVHLAQNSGNKQPPSQIVYLRDYRIDTVPGLEKRFNAAAWLNGKDKTNLLARELNDTQTYTDHTPDVGNLVLLKLDRHNVITSEQAVWRPGDTHGYNLEDPRAVVKDDKVLLGLTAVSNKPDTKGYYPFFPARARADRNNPTAIEELEIITKFGEGKNMMSLAVPEEEGDWWVFRPKGSDHKLLVLNENKRDKNRKLRAVGTLHLPKDLPGFRLRAGTSAPPVWHNENNGLFSFHGMEIKQGLYIYAQGLAGIKRRETPQEHHPFVLVNAVGPTLLPKDFNGLRGDDPMAFESHPKVRQAIYNTGAVVIGDKYRSFVNVGDTRTFFVDQDYSAMRESVKTKNNKEVVIYPRY